MGPIEITMACHSCTVLVKGRVYSETSGCERSVLWAPAQMERAQNGLHLELWNSHDLELWNSHDLDLADPMNINELCVNYTPIKVRTLCKQDCTQTVFQIK